MSPKFLAKQPQNDITLLMKEMVTIGAKVPTTPKGGNHGHTGIIIEDAKCQQMAEGTASVTPVNPELYPKDSSNRKKSQGRSRAKRLEAIKQNLLRS
jgi:hypothetical protein